MLGEKAFRELYMKYYDKAQALIDKYDPCGTRKHSELGLCFSDIIYSGGKQNPFRCCPGCRFHSKETGCQTKALGCKVWFCGACADQGGPKMEEFFKKMTALRLKIRKNLIYAGVRDGIDLDWIHYKHFSEITEAPRNERRAAA